MADNPSSFDVLQAYLLARASFSAEELAFMGTMFLPRRLAAGEFLQRAGDVARYAAFVARGCLRSFVIDGKGKEHVVQFAPEQ
jgi:CRP-like cAMP-binding protein